MTEKEIVIMDEQSLKDKIYVIRNQQVMLDTDLAEIYGYTTKAFNQQVKNNIVKFPEDFRFQLTKEEVDELSRSKILTSMQTKGVKGGRTHLPYAFTEQGIYMLISVLKGELATKQSITLIRLFKGMKDFLLENQPLLGQNNYAILTDKLDEHEKGIKEIKEKMITRDDLPEFMKLFDQGISNEEILVLDGQPFKADVAYQKIYRTAKKSIIVIDDYISVKTLHHLVHSKAKVKVTIISDNRNGILTQSEYNDFLAEYPDKEIVFIKAQKRAHDRYIILDNGTKDMKVYHCGASSKDAGKRITTISRMMEITGYKELIKELLSNPSLVLK